MHVQVLPVQTYVHVQTCVLMCKCVWCVLTCVQLCAQVHVVCKCVCMQMCVVQACVDMCVQACASVVRADVCLQMCVLTRKHLCVCKCVQVCLQVHVGVHADVCECKYMCSCVCIVCKHVCMCKCVCVRRKERSVTRSPGAAPVIGSGWQSWSVLGPEAQPGRTHPPLCLGQTLGMQPQETHALGLQRLRAPGRDTGMGCSVVPSCRPRHSARWTPSAPGNALPS